MNKNLTFKLELFDNDVGDVVYNMKSDLSSEIVDWVHETLYSFDPYDPDELEVTDKNMLAHDMTHFDVPSILNQLRHFDFHGGLTPYVLNLPGRHRKIVIKAEER